ncbi:MULTISPECIES: HEAT repeat domain-containing protein [Catenuloplanes]|uniref:HEAT repeat protein n=1 Tax=Catenuloplanes niger TaxID=587534 RepID=A0AAE3ZRQ9_9ACTN|nr:HEAT repeat domain-containing protein [Catenuloplanes niger]MDR7323706.1 HEAT repeat protein [Catenuloplanes niger]
MLDGLDRIDWAAMKHAYGSAADVPAMLLAMRSPDAAERSGAFDSFYGSVHHQGDVYRSTTAALPFLFALATDPGTPDRAAVVTLLTSIAGEVADIPCDDDVEPDHDYAVHDYRGAGVVLRDRGETFVALAADPDPCVRVAAIPAIGLIHSDGVRAATVLRRRLPAESDLVIRLAIVRSMGEIALRHPACAADVIAWLDALAADPGADAGTRLAAVVHRARSAPDRIGDDAVPAAIRLLRALTPTWPWRGSPPPRPPEPGAPPEVTAVFDELDRANRVFAPTTGLLHTFHRTLAGRVADRAALLAEQLRSADPGTRLDALRMSRDLVGDWRGDHTALITRVAGHLDEANHEVAAEAAVTLQHCAPLSAPVADALAAVVSAAGPGAWSAPDPQARRAHQEAVQALALLGDARAVPSLLAALDGDVDSWRAVRVAGRLPGAAGRLVPRLLARLRRIDPADPRASRPGSALVSALSALGDPAAVPAIAGFLSATGSAEDSSSVRAALSALRAFGPAAAPALDAVRTVAATRDRYLGQEALAALWAIGRDRHELLPLLLDALADDAAYAVRTVGEALGEIGPPAAAALPRLRELLNHDYDWVRLHSADAIRGIAGEPEAPAVVDTLLAAWARNGFAGPFVVACLSRMGRAAAPALPHLRAQLAMPQRYVTFSSNSVAPDEELQLALRALVTRLG